MIADEHQRKTLHYLLASQLSSAEIVMGKLGARMVHIATFVALGIPVVCLLALYGGLNPANVCFIYAGTLTTVFFASGLSILVSIMARRPRDAILAAYFLEALWLLVPLWFRPIARYLNHGPLWWVHSVTEWALITNPFSGPRSFWFLRVREGVLLDDHAPVAFRADLPHCGNRLFAAASRQFVAGSTAAAGPVVAVGGAAPRDDECRGRSRAHATDFWSLRRNALPAATTRCSGKSVTPRSGGACVARKPADAAGVQRAPGMLPARCRLPRCCRLLEWQRATIAAVRCGQRSEGLKHGAGLVGSARRGRLVRGQSHGRARTGYMDQPGDDPADARRDVRAKQLGAIWTARWIGLAILVMWVAGPVIGTIHPLGVLAAACYLVVIAWLIATMGVLASSFANNSTRALVTTFITLLIYTAISRWPMIVWDLLFSARDLPGSWAESTLSANRLLAAATVVVGVAPLAAFQLLVGALFALGSRRRLRDVGAMTNDVAGIPD